MYEGSLEGWQRELPQEEGDWLWINQWSCGCCLMANGIAYIQEWPEDDPTITSDDWTYRTKDGRLMLVGWGGQKPFMLESGPEITYWRRVVLPPYPADMD